MAAMAYQQQLILQRCIPPLKARPHIRQSLRYLLHPRQMSSALKIASLGSVFPDSDKSHHVGNPPTSFRNPWPSAGGERASLFKIFTTRFGSNPAKTNVPLPVGRNGERSEELVRVQAPDWAVDKPDKLRATWIGHASFLIELPVEGKASRGVRIFLDPVFAERMSPVSFAGPKRFTPTPFKLEEAPDVDIVCISHNHYDHLDLDALTRLYRLRKGKIHIFAPLGNKKLFNEHVQCSSDDATDLDWWDSVQVSVPLGDGTSSVKITCCPAQHGSARTAFDHDTTLWCSWAIEAAGKKLYFAGDTAYQAAGAPSPCPSFEQLGKTLGPFDLALLPIGCYKPSSFMAKVHASPSQSLQIHKDVKSNFSIGMHYMTIRGALSSAFEAVADPSRDWRECAEKEGIWCGGGLEGDGTPATIKPGGVGLCNIGETVSV